MRHELLLGLVPHELARDSSTIDGMRPDDGTNAGRLDPDLCQRCNLPLTESELADGICDRCAEKERNLNFTDVEHEVWRDGF